MSSFLSKKKKKESNRNIYQEEAKFSQEGRKESVNKLKIQKNLYLMKSESEGTVERVEKKASNGKKNWNSKT